MRKIKILQFPMRDMFAGGVTQYVLRNWSVIDKSRFQFDLATCDPNLTYSNLFTDYGSKVHYIYCRAEYEPDKFNAEFEKILDEGYDAIHLHTGYWRGFAAEEAAVRKGVPRIIVHAHNNGFNVTHDPRGIEKIQSEHEKWKDKFNESLATHFCAASKAAADFLFGHQIPREKVNILPNAIDVAKFAFNPQIRTLYREKLGLNDKFVIGHIGRFEYQKNHNFLINVFASVAPIIKNAVLLLVGDGSLQDEIKSKVDKLGLIERVLFLGVRTDVENLYQAMDIFCLTSYFEGLAICLIEAQCTGTTTTTTTTTMPENTITDNIVGLPYDIDLWREYVVRVAREGYERRDYSAEVTKAGYSIKEQIHQLERIYAEED
jgi:glycosyltransferase involved in cell wall biosynthesis